MTYITSAHVVHVSQSEFETALGFGWLFSFQYVQIMDFKMDRYKVRL